MTPERIQGYNSTWESEKKSGNYIFIFKLGKNARKTDKTDQEVGKNQVIS
jgi:hypothetical protein